jgi:hypothetical protein
MTGAGVLERWRAAVLRSRHIDGETRCLLLLLAETVDEHGHVTANRAALARTFGRAERRVQERLARARAAGFLDVLTRQARGRPMVYAITVPVPHGETQETRGSSCQKGPRVSPVDPTMWDTRDVRVSPVNGYEPGQKSPPPIPGRVYCTDHPAPSVAAPFPEHRSTTKNGTSRPAGAVDPATHQGRWQWSRTGPGYQRKAEQVTATEWNAPDALDRPAAGCEHNPDGPRCLPCQRRDTPMSEPLHPAGLAHLAAVLARENAVEPRRPCGCCDRRECPQHGQQRHAQPRRGPRIR